MHKLKAVFFAFILLLLPALALADEPLALTNADFGEVGLADGLPLGWYAESWLNGEGQYTIERTLDETGGPALCIDNLVENDVRLCQRIPVEGGGLYRLSCEARPENVVGGAGVNVSVVDSLAASEPLLGSGDWQTISLTGRADDSQSELAVCVRLGGYGSLSAGRAYFRNFRIEKLDAAPAGADVSYFGVAVAGSTEDAGAHNVNELHGGAMAVATLLVAALGAWLYKAYIVLPGEGEGEKRSANVQLGLILGLAFLLRCALSLLFYGHSTDIACFMAWANTLAENGPGAFYTSGMFADYPPGYMYVLWFTGSLAKWLNLSYGGAGYVLLTKMPAILCDLGAAYLVFRMADKRFERRVALALCYAVAFNPAMAFLSGGWGQIDQVLTLLLVLTLWLFLENRLELCGLVYGVAILVKPQALMAGPLLAAAYFIKIKDQGWKTALRTLWAVLLALGAILLLSLPFCGGQGNVELSLFGATFQGPWVLQKLLGTATSYPYASIEAFNLFSLFGGNWQNVDAPFVFSISYGQWGTACICLAVLFSIWMYIKGRKDRGCLALCTAFLLAALFTLGQYMHERYLFPVLLLILITFIYYGDRRLFLCFVFFTCSLLLNSLAAFMVVKDTALRGEEYLFITRLGSALTVAAFAYFAWACYDITVKRRTSPAFEGDRRAADIRPGLDAQKQEKEARFTKRDRLWCGALTGLYALVALLNLGTLQAPETAWQAGKGEGVTIRLEREATLSSIRVFGGLYTGTSEFTDDEGNSFAYEEDNGDMFRWVKIGGEGWETGAVTLRVTEGSVWFNEIAFFDEGGNQVPITSCEALAAAPGLADAALLIDEQDQVPAAPSYLNGMYFDELYHARTAYEHLHGLVPYENSHPPLGKVFIMLGVALFGMNTFGWRIAGTLFGIAMVPILYLFAKRLFKRSDYALLCAGLFAFDFMHFSQTRIATVDVFGVFFILLMFYFMHEYYCMNFFTDGLGATLKPLAWAGVFFGLGAASKWICIYAGGGLAVIFFTSLGQRYMEYRKQIRSGDVKKRAQVARFWRQAVLTLLWCCLFYILVPVCIYLASYLPYVLSEMHYDLGGIWNFQKFMFDYHSNLTATHPYESPWWQWPLNLRPVWYYVGYDVRAGYASTISAFGNPAVWWACSLGTLILAVRLILGNIRREKGMFVLMVAVCANYLPWVLVTRCTFAYHYFATVPFLILCTGYLLLEAEARHPSIAPLKWLWLGVSIALFALFYPVISGLAAPDWFIHWLEWLPSWTFLGY